MNSEYREPIGIIQSRGLGDILIALPIAKYFYDRGRKVVWPICQEFYGSVKDTAPWVDWIPIQTDSRAQFFYERPNFELGKAGCKEIICLYQALSGRPELSSRNYFQIQKFDEHKYSAAGVPFRFKWTLRNCITRNLEREQQHFDKVVKSEGYYVTHLKGSTFKTSIDLSYLPKEWQRIDIDDHMTDCIFDWVKILEGAQAVITLDSAVSNLIDQFDIDVDKYWIPRSHIHLTPVLGSTWTILEPPSDSLAAKTIFGVSK